MPGGDRTGPRGLGPKAGRAAGYCGGYNVPGYMNPVPGRFAGCGGRGRGFRRYWWSYPDYPGYQYLQYPDYPGQPAPSAPRQMEPEDEIKYLETVAETLKKDLETIEKRINELSEGGTE
ncbi:MAG: DUF5320 domain-containing protein [Theionarchaea archaeon]|nr:DUF5320 domain-containing protein [Theionarchaea archaeon]